MGAIQKGIPVALYNRRIFERKKHLRRYLARLPYKEKVKMILRLQELSRHFKIDPHSV